mgnify:FL=1|jgi:hypothetical protein
MIKPNKSKPTLECIMCGSLLIGDEPRIRTVCYDCKDKRPAPLGAMSPFVPIKEK